MLLTLTRCLPLQVYGKGQGGWTLHASGVILNTSLHQPVEQEAHLLYRATWEGEPWESQALGASGYTIALFCNDSSVGVAAKVAELAFKRQAQVLPIASL